MKAKTLSATELIKRNDKIAHELFRAIQVATKLMDGFAELVGTSNTGNVFAITIMCPEPDSMVQVAADIVNKQERCVVVSKRTVDGSFDWRSDTYNKPAYTITFKVT